MTNQAAQTMPELPDSQYRGGNDVFGKEFPLYTAAQMHQYARDYAAMLAAAPAASGGESAASVSERARELEQAQRLAVSLWERNYKESSPDWEVDETLTGVLLQISNMVSGMSPRSNADNRFADLVVSLRDRAKWGRGGQFTSPHDSEGTSRLLDMAADALEQALTQQRGECVAEVFEDSTGCRFPRWAPTVRQLPVPGTKLYTTPQPSADAVREVTDGMVFDDVAVGEIIQSHTGCGDSDSIYTARALRHHLFGEGNGHG